MQVDWQVASGLSEWKKPDIQTPSPVNGWSHVSRLNPRRCGIHRRSDPVARTADWARSRLKVWAVAQRMEPKMAKICGQTPRPFHEAYPSPPACAKKPTALRASLLAKQRREPYSRLDGVGVGPGSPAKARGRRRILTPTKNPLRSFVAELVSQASTLIEPIGGKAEVALNELSWPEFRLPNTSNKMSHWDASRERISVQTCPPPRHFP